MANLISEKNYVFSVPEGQGPLRIDQFLANFLENISRSKAQKLIKGGYVLVDGKYTKANYQVHPNDIIDVHIPITPRPDKAEPEDIPLDVVYEDEYLLVVNKPAGMVVHPAYANYTGTLVNALLQHTKILSDYNEPGRPGIVHRLDKDTSGLLVVAKEDSTHAQLAKQFSNRTIEREYWAVCWGSFDEPEGEIIHNITRSKKDRKVFTVSDNEKEGKFAHTTFQVLEDFSFASLIKLKLKTGRTHQIRVHLAHLRKPVFGDETYGGRKQLYGLTTPNFKRQVKNLLEIMPRQALHAKTIGFTHPQTGEKVSFDSELPEDMEKLLKYLREHFKT